MKFKRLQMWDDLLCKKRNVQEKVHENDIHRWYFTHRELSDLASILVTTELVPSSGSNNRNGK